MEFYINKSTDTVADLHLAYGFLQLLAMLTPDDAPLNPTLHDEGWSYRIVLDKPLRDEWIDNQRHPIRLNHFIQTASKTAIQRPAYIMPTDSIYYDDEKARYDNWRDAYWKLSAQDRRSDQMEHLLAEQGVHKYKPEFPIWALINQQKAIKSYNKIVMTWHQHQGEAFAGLLNIIFALFADPINDIDAAQQRWEKLAVEFGIDEPATQTITQTTSPSLGTGNHRTKADGVVETNLKLFWLIEYLRFGGLYAAGIPLEVRSNQSKKDRRTYIPIPNELSWNVASRNVFGDFRDAMMADTAVKLDILAVFRYITTYLQHWREAQKRSKGLGLSKGNPADHARAIGVLILKNMGSSHAVMGMNELHIPTWVHVETATDGAHFQKIIEEHLTVVRSLDESHSDEYSLLRDYRRFLSSGDLHTLLSFTRGFGSVTMSRLNAGSYAPQFTLPYLEEVLMAVQDDLAPILQDPGFRAIAEAIRRSTVIPQYQKARKSDNTYDIRYGLGDKLARAANDSRPNRFLKELTEFMHYYNRETARVAETRNMQFRKAITVEDIEGLVQLIDRYGDHKLIAGLLVAYGYARDPEMGKREDQPTEQGAE